jgi:hypothetical protein
MDRPGQFLGQHLVYRALALDPGSAGELRASDRDPKMRFTALAPAGVTMVLIGLVLDFQSVRCRAPACSTGFCHHICIILRDNPDQGLIKGGSDAGVA